MFHKNRPENEIIAENFLNDPITQHHKTRQRRSQMKKNEEMSLSIRS